MACTAPLAAPSVSCSPMRRATKAVVENERPMAMANTVVKIPSVKPTVATASEPSRDTQNTSTIANKDSMIISSTMGIARSVIAVERLPSV